MNWTDLVRRAAARADVPQDVAQAVLAAAMDEAVEQLAQGESVRLNGVGTLQRKWVSGRAVRSIESGRKMWVGGRHAVRFATAAGLRRRLEEGTDQSWRSPEQQAAWRLAETLIGDLDLYSKDRVPRGISADMDYEQVHGLCAAALGDDWQRAWTTWRSKVSPEAAHTPHLARAARRRWAER